MKTFIVISSILTIGFLGILMLGCNAEKRYIVEPIPSNEKFMMDAMKSNARHIYSLEKRLINIEDKVNEIFNDK